MSERRPPTGEEELQDEKEQKERNIFANLRLKYGDSILDDLFRMFPSIRMDAFPPGCLTVVSIPLLVCLHATSGEDASACS